MSAKALQREMHVNEQMTRRHCRPVRGSTKDAEAGTLMSPYSTHNEGLQYSDRFAVGPSLASALIMSLFCLGVLVFRSPLLKFLLKFTGTRY